MPLTLSIILFLSNFSNICFGRFASLEIINSELGLKTFIPKRG